MNTPFNPYTPSVFDPGGMDTIGFMPSPSSQTFLPFVAGTTIGAIIQGVEKTESIERGHYVQRVPTVGLEVRVPLRKMARKLQVSGVQIGAEAMRELRRMEGTEIGAVGEVEIGALLSKIKNAAKKAVKATVNAAKKVADNKVVKGLYQAAKAVAPSPISNALQAAEMGAKLGKALAKGNPKAKAAKPIADKLAAGKITVDAAKAAAKKVGVKPAVVTGAAATMKLAKSNSPAAKAVLQTAKEIEKTREAKPSAPKASALPAGVPANAKRRQIPINGKMFNTLVWPA